MTMSDVETDQYLVERTQAGDKHAFELLVTRYQGRLSRLIARFVRDPAEQEEVTQDAFIRAYRALATFRGDSAFYTWLYRIAINTAKNHLAASGRRIPSTSYRQQGEDDEPIDDALTPRDLGTPESLLLSKEMAETVNQAIDSLPEDLRTAIQMREIEGLSYEEIAGVMDCPIGTVRSRIFRAREAIAGKLRPLLDLGSRQRW